MSETCILSKIQFELNAPKNQYNSFGKYNYRNCEDVLEALKPHLNKHNCYLIISDEAVNVGDRYYIKATATLMESGDRVLGQASACAREAANRKGMDESQLTGATSSYARKYALNGLFAIDDNKDADATNKGEKKEKVTLPTESPITEGQRKKLWAMLNTQKVSREDAKSFMDWSEVKSKKDASKLIEDFEKKLEEFQSIKSDSKKVQGKLDEEKWKQETGFFISELKKSEIEAICKEQAD